MFHDITPVFHRPTTICWWKRQLSGLQDWLSIVKMEDIGDFHPYGRIIETELYGWSE